MLYLDYGRDGGDYVPNQYGGKENIDAIHFLRRFNERVYAEYPDVMTFAEESTSWSMVSAPDLPRRPRLRVQVEHGLDERHPELLLAKTPIYREYHQNDITFSMLYAFTENFLLPFSHDEVVHGKGSMLGKMPGDDWQKFANLRALYAYMFGHPGKKLLFMGNEFGQWNEWNHDASLDWHLLEFEPHQGLRRCVRDLNKLYRSEPALYEHDCEWEGFEWIDCNDAHSNAVTFIRKGKNPDDTLIFGCNFSPVPRHGYHIGCPREGFWEEIFNSDASWYGGSDCGNAGGVEAREYGTHGRPCTLEATLPPLGVAVFKRRP